MRAPRRGWKLELGDHRAEVAGADKRLKHKRRGPARPLNEPTWTPSAGAKRVGVEAGVRLSAWVARNRECSVREAKKLIESGVVRVDGLVETFASHALARGQVVEIFAELAPTEHHFDPKRVLFDEGGVFAYDKPAWLPVTPTDAVKSWSLLDILKQQFELIIPVHRIDADTSGIVLFAREEKLARRMEEAFRDHHVHKTYMAIVRGQPREKGEHRSYLVQKDKGQGFETWESGHGQDARAAITTWEVIEQLGQFGAMVRVEPKTGRHHQIRIHFAEMGNPLYGDRRHGDRRDPVQAPRHMLHAWRLVCPHPSGTGELRITAPVPKEFNELCERIRKLRR